MKLRDHPDFPSCVAIIGVALIGLGLMAACVLMFLSLPGCSSWGDSASRVVGKAGESLTATQAAGGFGILDWVFGGCIVMAAVLGVVAIASPSNARPMLIGGLVASAVCAIALKVLLVKYLDWIVWAIGIGSIAAGCLYAYAHRWVVEKFLRRDFDGDGVIGEPKQETPP